MPRSCESLSTHGDYSVEKALSELCPNLSAGISLNTRRYLVILHSNKSTKDDTPAENEKYFKSRGSLKRDSLKSNVSSNNSSINDSANIILFGEVFLQTYIHIIIIIITKNMTIKSHAITKFHNFLYFSQVMFLLISMRKVKTNLSILLPFSMLKSMEM